MTSRSPSALGMRNEPADIDGLPPKTRALVHEFGWSVVRAFLDSGVTDPQTIRHLIHTVWAGPREAANARTPKVDGTHRAIDVVGAFLVRSGCAVNARALIGLLRQQNLVLLPREPIDEMVEAAGCDRAGLRRAVLAAERRFWPFLGDK